MGGFVTEKENRTIRILYILKILWEETDENHPISATQLAVKVSDYGVDCERKAVYRYLEILEDFGMDIVKTRRGVYLASRQLELPELKLLVDAVWSSKFITEKKSQELINKLTKLLSTHDSDQLKRQVFIKNRIKTMNESIYYNIDAIYEAIRENKKIVFTYWNWNPKKEMVTKHDGRQYVVSPWILTWEDEKYYLVGYDDRDQQMKHFRVDKIQKIEVKEEAREGNEQFKQINKGALKAQTFGMFQGKKETVTLQMKNELAGVAIDRFGKDVWIRPVDDEHFHVVVDVMVSNQFYGWVAGLGGGAKIVGPDWVTDEYRRLLTGLLDET